MVHDHDAFGSWVAEHYPSEATGVIRVPADQLETVMAAIGFALSEEVSAAVSVAVEVRPAWSGTFLEGLAVDVEETTTDEGTAREFTIADPISGELVPGTTGTRSGAKLVVSLDRDRRTIALTEARETAEAIIAKATEGEAPPEADRAALDHRRRELEGMPAEVLTEVARRMELVTARRWMGNSWPARASALAIRAEAIEACGSREQLRAYAKANGVPPSGTKTDVAKRLAAAGHTADAIAAST